MTAGLSPAVLDGAAVGETPVPVELTLRVQAFLYREARLADESRYKEWLALWSQDAVYWVPSNADTVDPVRQVSIIYDDRRQLEDRIFRLLSPSAHSQEPPSRMRRVVSNVEIGLPAADGASPQDGTLVVESNFCLVEVRRNLQTVYGGRNQHLLRPVGDSFEIVRKKVMLVNNDTPLGNLTFLI